MTRRQTRLVSTVAVGCALTVNVVAQRGGRSNAGAESAGPPQGPNAVPIVAVVGCLAEGPNGTWMVTNATEPVRATPGFAKAEDVKAAESQPLGTLRFRLIGLVEMNPAEHRGHKIAAKGMLIKDSANDRLNVTSLITIGTTCAP